MYRRLLAQLLLHLCQFIIILRYTIQNNLQPGAVHQLLTVKHLLLSLQLLPYAFQLVLVLVHFLQVTASLLLQQQDLLLLLVVLRVVDGPLLDVPGWLQRVEVLDLAEDLALVVAEGVVALG